MRLVTRLFSIAFLCASLLAILPVTAEAVITATANKCQNSSSAPSTTIACTMPGTTTSGNSIIACVYWNGATEGEFVSITDGTNTYTLRAGTYGMNDAQSQKCGDSINITGAAIPTITATFSSSFLNRSLIVQEFTNIAVGGFDQSTSSVPDAVGTGVDAATTGVTGTRAQANEVIVAAVVTTNTASVSMTAGTGYTEILNITNWGQMEFKVVSSIGTDAATWTLSGSANLITSLATYKDVVAGGGGATPRNLMLLGVGP
jgi:hypothetical protein